jgi:hypothetical protein
VVFNSALKLTIAKEAELVLRSPSRGFAKECPSFETALL